MEVLSVKEACEKFRMPDNWFRQQIREGNINHFQSGKKYLVTDKAVESFLLRGGENGSSDD